MKRHPDYAPTRPPAGIPAPPHDPHRLHSVECAEEFYDYSTGFHGVRVALPDHAVRVFFNAFEAVAELLPYLTLPQLEHLKLRAIREAQLSHRPLARK